MKRILMNLKPSTNIFNYFNYITAAPFNKVINNLQNLLTKVTNLPKTICNKFSKINFTLTVQKIITHLKDGPKKKFSYWRYDYGAM